MSINNHTSAGASSITPNSNGSQDDNNAASISEYGLMFETIIQDLDLAIGYPSLNDNASQQEALPVLTHSSPLTNQEIVESRKRETIIHIPDHRPGTSAISFAPSMTLSNRVSTEYNTADKKSSTGQRISWKLLKDSSTNRWIKDSKRTMKSVHVDTSNHREELNEYKNDLENPTPQTTELMQSGEKAKLDIPSQLYGVQPNKVLRTGTVHYGAKNPIEPSIPRKLPPVPPDEGGLSSTGKRYHDPRLGKKANKAALKTAVTLFSNERTFNHWIKFAMLLGALAMTLLNFSSGEVSREVDQSLALRAGKIGKLVGVCLMAICLICLVYAASIFHWRHLGVARGKRDDRYFDRIGPTILTLALLATYSINVILTIQVTSNMNPNYLPTVFFNEHSGSNASMASQPSFASHPPFNTPSLPNGPTILVDDNGDDTYDGEHPSTSQSNSTTVADIEFSEEEENMKKSEKSMRTTKSENSTSSRNEDE